MGWAILLLLGGATLAGLMLVARPARGAVGMLVAALLVAAAGYAWQGSPALPGSPTPPSTNHRAADTLFAQERTIWLERVGPEAQLLDAADSLIRNGDADYAIAILRGGVARAPNSMMLWLGLGNALATYADGMVTPAARYAFERAAAIAPRHPAPGYFLGLAYAQAGDLDTAERIWRSVLANSPADAPWRALVEQRLGVIARIRAAG